jgi:cytochrome P450
MCFQVVGFVTVRMSNRDLSLDDGKLVIPRNANIFLPVGLPHMSSAVYKDADQFLPERWLEPDAEYMPGGVSILFSVLSHADATQQLASV